MALAASQRYTRYDPVVLTSEYEVNFPLFDDDDLEVRIDGDVTTDFSVTASYQDGRSLDATITLVTAVTGKPVEIYGSRVPRRENDYLSSGAGLAEKIERDIEAVTATQQEQARDFERALKLPPQTGADGEIKQDATERANTVLTFDAAGNPALGLVGDLSGDFELFAPLSGAAFTGIVTFGANALFGNNALLQFGTSANYTVSYDGTDLNVRMPTTGGAIRFIDGNNFQQLRIFPGAGIFMRYQADERIRLTDVGITLDGEIIGTSVATQAEAEAGTVTNKLMTPERTKEAIDEQVAVFSDDDVSTGLKLIGYAKITDGPSLTFTLDFSEGFSSVVRSAGGTYSFTFDTERSDTQYMVMPSTAGGARVFDLGNEATTGFDVRTRRPADSVLSNTGFAVMVYEQVS